jgi:hypothetical protein
MVYLARKEFGFAVFSPFFWLEVFLSSQTESTSHPLAGDINREALLR